jgi:hypothetical protein
MRWAGDDVYLWSGYQRIVEHFHGIARTNPHFHLGLGTPIAGLSYDEENERVRVLTKSGEAFEAAHVIVTASLGVLKEGDIAFSPALPPRRLRAIQSLGMGLLDKVVLQYDSVWWDMAEDACLIFIPSTPPLPLLRSLFVNSFAHRGKAILVLYINPEDAPAVEALSDAELANWAHPLLADRLPRAAQTTGSPAPPTRTMATRWLQDEYSRGSYSYMPVAGPNDGDDAPSPLDIIELSHALWDQRLGFAGEHTEVDHYVRYAGPFSQARPESDTARSPTRTARSSRASERRSGSWQSTTIRTGYDRDVKERTGTPERVQRQSASASMMLWPPMSRSRMVSAASCSRTAYLDQEAYGTVLGEEHRDKSWGVQIWWQRRQRWLVHSNGCLSDEPGAASAATTKGR